MERVTPGPEAIGVAAAALSDLPNLADGSEGGGDSTDTETMFAPRRITRPSDLFSSVTVPETGSEPGADFFCCDLILRNSSESANMRFICYSEVSYLPYERWFL